jgi:hypothetical protein
MTIPSFFLPYESHANESLSGFLVTLRTAASKPVGDVTIRDLCAMEKYPNGLYFFFGGEPHGLQYVGKCTSRSFVERIPSHFDQREKAWFNTLPTRLVCEGVPYPAALAAALNFHVVLLGGITDGAVARKLEGVFRNTYCPKLNSPRNPRGADWGSSLVALA